MKKNIPVRILTVLGGLVLLALAGCVVAEGFFGVSLTQLAGGLLSSGTVLAVLAKLALVLALAALAVAAVLCALPSRRPRQSDYVMQKGENGDIGISVKAIEKKVLACVAKHSEITGAEVAVREVREGIIILLNVDQVSGVSIPMSVGLLQKQVRQYVSQCTGVDVLEVRVMVDNRTDAQVESAFVVEDTVVPTIPRKVEEFRQESQPPVEAPVEQLRQIAEITEMTVQNLPDEEEPEEPQAEEPAQPVADLDALLPAPEAEPEEFEEEEKPLHQRVFGAEEEPLTVPMPPEMAAAADAEPEEAAAPEEEPEAQAPAEPEAPEAFSVTEDWTEPSLQEAADALLNGEAPEEGESPEMENDADEPVGDAPAAEMPEAVSAEEENDAAPAAVPETDAAPEQDEVPENLL